MSELKIYFNHFNSIYNIIYWGNKNNPKIIFWVSVWGIPWSLLTVCVLAMGYIVISALVIFNVEPESFNTFFDSIYWATVSLTTMGYGDIYPVTNAGRVVTMVSAIFGIAIIALPAGIITAGYMEEVNKK